MNRHLLSLAALLVMVLLAFGSADTSSTPSGSGGSGSEGTKRGSTPLPGETFRFSGDVFACQTENDLDRINTLSVAKDELGLKQMMLQGRLVVITGGTEAKVIDLGFLSTEVRIMSGSLAGQSVFVSTDFVKK